MEATHYRPNNRISLVIQSDHEKAPGTGRLNRQICFRLVPYAPAKTPKHRAISEGSRLYSAQRDYTRRSNLMTCCGFIVSLVSFLSLVLQFQTHHFEIDKSGPRNHKRINVKCEMR